MAYTPGVARVCTTSSDDPRRRFEYTIKSNTVAVVSDGTAVLGLGDIGPEAAMPVMEGKAMLFKEFADVDAFPICLDTKDPDAIVETVKPIAPTFGGINLEDISSPRCFEIEQRLVEELDIPVFHDDQHGTAIVVLAALLNACRLTGRADRGPHRRDGRRRRRGSGGGQDPDGLGYHLDRACDRFGAIHPGRSDYQQGTMNVPKTWLAEHTNSDGATAAPGSPRGRDLFIGLSGPGLIEAADLQRMNPDPFVFAMANPNPEVRARGGRPVRAGDGYRPLRLPQPDQQRARLPGHLPRRTRRAGAGITEEMKVAAAHGHRRRRVGRGAGRGLHRAERVQPRSEPCGGERRSR